MVLSAGIDLIALPWLIVSEHKLHLILIGSKWWTSSDTATPAQPHDEAVTQTMPPAAACDAI